jgi:succinylglutamic semialdehyde dehydrogenase
MSRALVSVSPSDPADVLGAWPSADAGAVDAAVGRARKAFSAWRDAGFEARAAVLRRFAEEARERVPELAELISREVGKALWDSCAEASLLAPKVDVTLDTGMAHVAPVEVAPGQRATFFPRGVLAVYGPFNFPVHLPNGHIVPALATGNTVVFKPSELAPATGEWMVSLWREIGLPDGVLEIAQGSASTGEALALHPDVDGVLFTGSYETGRAIQQATLDQPHKLLALELGGSNALIVCEDADLDLAVSEAAISIAASTGQRCTCARRLFVAREVADVFTEKLIAVLSGLSIGDPFDENVFMGPLASRAAHERVVARRALAEEAGGERILLVTPDLPPPYIGPGLVRFPGLRQDHPYQREETFGPEAALYTVDDLDEAIAAANDTDYGLVASVMTRDRAKYERCVGRIRTGLLNWNKATVGASGKLPFGGIGKSGNDRPAGATATLYCTVAQAHLESEAEFDPHTLPPGMPRP